MIKKIRRWVQILFVVALGLALFVFLRSRGMVPGFSRLDKARKAKVLSIYEIMPRKRAQCDDFFVDQNYSAMEKRISNLLRPPLTSAAMEDLSTLYASLADIPEKNMEQQSQMEKTLSGWCRAFPKSQAPWIARGGFRLNQAWISRKNHLSREVDPRAWGAIQDRLENAKSDLERAASLSHRDPHVGPWRISVAMALGEDPKVIESAFQRSENAFPGLPWTWAAKTTAISPKWGGTLEGLESWVETIQASTGTHPQLKWALLEGWHEMHHAYERRGNRNFLGQPKIWSQLEAYYRPGLETHPEDMWYLSLYTKMAVDAGKMAEAWKGFSILGNRFYDSHWRDLKTYHDWRLFSGGDVAISLLQAGRDKEAKAVLLELLPMNPTAAWIPFHLARLAYIENDSPAFFENGAILLRRLFL